MEVLEELWGAWGAAAVLWLASAAAIFSLASRLAASRLSRQKALPLDTASQQQQQQQQKAPPLRPAAPAAPAQPPGDFFPAATAGVGVCTLDACRPGATCDNAVMEEIRRHPLLAAFLAPCGSGRWWETRNADGATLFLFLILLRDYALARRLVGALQRHGHAAAARYLLSASYSSGARDLYTGENALHMLIAQRHKGGEVEEGGCCACQGEAGAGAAGAAADGEGEGGPSLGDIRWLVRACPALVQGRATGQFFQASRYTDQRADDTCAWGEYPLSFAVSINEPEIVLFLVREAGADLLAQDTHGNTALHAAVINKVSRSMIYLLRDLWSSLQLLERGEGEAAAGACACACACVAASASLFPVPRHSARGCNAGAVAAPAGAAAAAAAALPAVPLTLDRVVNNEGLTPLMLAALLDTKESTGIFKDMINHLKYGRGVSWAYAHVSCYAFPLEGLDDISDHAAAAEAARAGLPHPLEAFTRPRLYPAPTDASEARYQGGEDVAPFEPAAHPPRLWPRRTLLEVIAQNPVQDMHGVCGEEFVKVLLEKKWLMYAGSSTLTSVCLTLGFLLALSVVVVQRAGGGGGGGGGGGQQLLRVPALAWLQAAHLGRGSACAAASGSAPGCSALILGELAVVASCVASLARIACAWARAARRAWAESAALGVPPPPPAALLAAYLTQCHGSTSLGRLVSLSVCLLVFFLCALVLGGGEEHPAFFVALSLTCCISWLSLLRFAMGWESLAHFVVMIQKMVVEDVSRFLGVAGILLAAFAHAFFILGRFENKAFGTVLFRSLLALVGEGEVQVDSAEGPRAGNTAFQVAYLVGGSLVLLNVLIAMMGKTYEDVSSVAKVLATIERARIIREVEEGMTPAERLAPLQCLPNWLFSFLFVDEAGVGGGVEYWTRPDAIVPPPVMAAPLSGLCLVMNQGEGATVAKVEADHMNSVTERLGGELARAVAFTGVLGHRLEGGGGVSFRLHSTAYVKSPVCGEDKMERVDAVEWHTQAQLQRLGVLRMRLLREYCAAEGLQLQGVA